MAGDSVSNLREGDYVRWDTDVDKVYSRDTKTLVGKVGKILPKRDKTNNSAYDVEFTYNEKFFLVHSYTPVSAILTNNFLSPDGTRSVSLSKVERTIFEDKKDRVGIDILYLCFAAQIHAI